MSAREIGTRCLIASMAMVLAAASPCRGQSPCGLIAKRVSLARSIFDIWICTSKMFEKFLFIQPPIKPCLAGGLRFLQFQCLKSGNVFIAFAGAKKFFMLVI